MRADIVPGGIFPDYELTDHAKTRRRLSDLQGNDPMILGLSRGHYCPRDHQQHLELATWQPQIAVAYTRIVTISTDNIVESREFRASVGANWTFLSDAGRKAQQDLDIAEVEDQGSEQSAESGSGTPRAAGLPLDDPPHKTVARVRAGYRRQDRLGDSRPLAAAIRRRQPRDITRIG